MFKVSREHMNLFFSWCIYCTTRLTSYEIFRFKVSLLQLMHLLHDKADQLRKNIYSSAADSNIYKQTAEKITSIVSKMCSILKVLIMLIVLIAFYCCDYHGSTLNKWRSRIQILILRKSCNKLIRVYARIFYGTFIFVYFR